MRVTREGGDGDGEKGAAARSQCPRGKSLQHKGKDECPERRRGERTVDELSLLHFKLVGAEKNWPCGSFFIP